jgi:hypothetical protein
MAIALNSARWPAEFREDRRKLFPDVDFDHIDLDHAMSQLRAHAGFVDQQLSDGRAFLTGPSPGLVDIHAWTTPWFARPNMPVVNELLAAYPRLAAWEERVAALGEGTRRASTAAAAFAVARASTPEPGVVDVADAQGLEANMEVEVVPDDTLRGAVRGRIAAAGPNEIALHHSDPKCGAVVVHFPRLGYRIRPLAAARSARSPTKG